MTDEQSNDQTPAGDGPLVGRWADSLELHGGPVLVLGGIALVVLACVFASRPAVAPIFAGFGAVLFLLGVFYSRIEGRLEASKNGVSATVRAARRQAREANLPPDLVDEVVAMAVARFEALSRPRTPTERVAEATAGQAVSEASSKHARIENAFAAWLREEGFEVLAPALPTAFDLWGKREDQDLIAEIKISSRIPPQALRALDEAVPPGHEGGLLRRALVIPPPPVLTAEAIDLALQAGIEVYVTEGDGAVSRLPL